MKPIHVTRTRTRPDSISAAQFVKAGFAKPALIIFPGRTTTTANLRDLVTGGLLTVGTGVTIGRDAEGPYLLFDGTSEAYIQLGWELQSSSVKNPISIMADIQTSGTGNYMSLVSKFREDLAANQSFKIEIEYPNSAVKVWSRTGTNPYSESNYYSFPARGYRTVIGCFSSTDSVTGNQKVNSGFNVRAKTCQTPYFSGNVAYPSPPSLITTTPVLVGASWTAAATRGRNFQGKIRWLVLWNTNALKSELVRPTMQGMPLWQLITKKRKTVYLPTQSREWFVSAKRALIAPHPTWVRGNTYQVGDVVKVPIQWRPTDAITLSYDGFLFMKVLVGGVSNVHPYSSRDVYTMSSLPKLVTTGMVYWEDVTGTTWDLPALNPSMVSFGLHSGDIVYFDIESGVLSTTDLVIRSNIKGVASYRDWLWLEHTIRGHRIQVRYADFNTCTKNVIGLPGVKTNLRTLSGRYYVQLNNSRRVNPVALWNSARDLYLDNVQNYAEKYQPACVFRADRSSPYKGLNGEFGGLYGGSFSRFIDCRMLSSTSVKLGTGSMEVYGMKVASQRAYKWDMASTPRRMLEVVIDFPALVATPYPGPFTMNRAAAKLEFIGCNMSMKDPYGTLRSVQSFWRNLHVDHDTLSGVHGMNTGGEANPVEQPTTEAQTANAPFGSKSYRIGRVSLNGRLPSMGWEHTYQWVSSIATAFVPLYGQQYVMERFFRVRKYTTLTGARQVRVHITYAVGNNLESTTYFGLVGRPVTNDVVWLEVRYVKQDGTAGRVVTAKTPTSYGQSDVIEDSTTEWRHQVTFTNSSRRYRYLKADLPDLGGGVVEVRVVLNPSMSATNDAGTALDPIVDIV